MNVALWILQVLLAVIFAWHGWLFISPPAELIEIMGSGMACGNWSRPAWDHAHNAPAHGFGSGRTHDRARKRQRTSHI
jgi:uncharacterized membrane protein YphA (DoxX/SURF4 family)